MKDTTRKWLEAGKVIAINPDLKVECPECGHNNLEVQDIRSEATPAIIERIMSCPSCHATNMMRLNRT